MSDPLTLPLRGSRLIEASAGTGKTWTIAALYLRLVLGHGVAPLAPGQILVMTFTKAATRELSDRIRARLVQAAACFRGDQAPADSLLAELLAAHPGEQRAAAAWRLAAAAEAMDDAAVHTIDAWCQRMLREHAFDSGSLFDEELQPDPAALLAQAARDYWRQQVYPLPAEALPAVQALWPDVDTLAKEAQALLEVPLPPAAGDGELGALLQGLQQRHAAALSALKQGWAERADQMLAWLQPLWLAKDSALDKRKLGAAHGTRWIEALRAWAADPLAEVLDLGKGAERLSDAGVRQALKPGHDLQPPGCFAEFGSLMQALAALPQPGPTLRCHAAARIARRLQQLKAQAGTFGFADLLQRLHDALDEAQLGERARRLRERILAQYPVALIDEFQDTSPVQLAIFDRLYRIAEDEPARALLLIGDPKQAIYGFRGADIHSYLQARQATAGRHHVLDTNRRSTAALVAEINRLFGAAEARPGAGAFLFRNAASGNGLPFVPVLAQGRAESLAVGGAPLPAVTVCLDAELRGMPDSREHLAALCAERIVNWLNDPTAAFEQPGQPPRRLRPADLAVLVRTGVEAAAVRQALRQRGVASVYLSDKDSVFASAEAADLLRLLQAMAAPRDMRLAHAALATPLLGLSLAELLELATDDALFDARCELLQQLHATWLQQGVLAAVRRALQALDLPARWLATPEGERRLTNLLHLAELLQTASTQREGPAALLHWLAAQVEQAGQGVAEEQVLRLESDADLVQVVTIHKSKGLEYPVVLLPFAAHHRAESGRDGFLLLRSATAGRRLQFDPSDAQLAEADLDRLREDLRLLYVALTRARHALWLGVSALKVGHSAECLWHRCALGHLVSGPEPRTPEVLALEVSALSGPELVVQKAGAPLLTLLLPPEHLPPLLAVPNYSASFDRLWAVTSYSALVKEASRSAAEALPKRLRDDEPAEDTAAVLAALTAGGPWHRFPRGALAGNFLHDQLEWLAGEGFALDESVPLQQALQRRCERQGWGHRAADVLAWLRRSCSTPMPALGVALSGLQRVLPEMEFWFPSDGLSARAVDSLCRQHLLPGRPRPELPERHLRGLLMGFADLVFEHQGRCFVLDYKSNALGVRDADYTAAAMEAAMLEHRYDVQAALYLLALHRLLKVRLGAAYVPALQLGGAVYLFLRGVESPGRGALHWAPPLALIEALDALLPAAGAPA